MDLTERRSDYQRIVIKLGSALVTDAGRGIAREAIGRWVAQIAAERAAGREIIIVSSGSVAEGMVRLGWKSRPDAVHELQAAAAVGQMGLIEAYESACQKHQLHTAQVLLTHDDLSNRRRYLNARSTLTTLLQTGVIPIINENDTVATDEIRFGDNDTLAALVANLVEADLLLILTDRDGLYTGDPGKVADAELISDGVAGDPQLDAFAGEGGALGRGGMQTKLKAAALAARSGSCTVIANGNEQDIICSVLSGERKGTFLRPSAGRVAARKQWLAGGLKPAGTLVIDAGAERVLLDEGRSLLAVGVVDVLGEFERGELVICRSADGRDLGRGLCNYSSADTRRIKGRSSDEIQSILGYAFEAELIHRDNLVLD